MKKKIFALILCICMCFSAFAGCALVDKKDKLNDDTVIAEYYGKQITYKDLKDKYNVYSQYFAYYDESVVMNIIFEETYLSAIQEVEAKKVVKLTTEDIDEIVEDVNHEVLHLVNEYEKGLIEADGGTVPARISEHKHDEEENPKAYKEYEFEPVTPKTFGEPATEPIVSELIEKVLDEVYDGVSEAEKTYRDRAWEKYVGDLMYSYKLSGTTLSKDKALEKKVLELYNTAKTAKINKLYREYIESLVFGDEDFEALSTGTTPAAIAFRTAIVNKYKELLAADKQNNTIEDNYTEVVFDSKNEKLVMYHHNGKNTFFTVQHLLVKFSDEQVAELKNYVGYDQNKDKMFREEYVNARKDMARDSITLEWLLETSYRDENGENVKENKLDEHGNPVYEKDEQDNFVYEKDEHGNNKLDGEGNPIPIPVKTDKDAKISLQDIKANFETELSTKMGEYLTARKAEENNPSYVLTEEEKSYVSGRLFNEYIYKYTNDDGALGSKQLVNTLGFGISSDEDEDGGLMHEFAEGARTLYNSYKIKKDTSDPSDDIYIGEELEFAITDYGVHVMMLTSVFDKGEIVATKDVLGADKEVDDIFDDMKDKVISNVSKQTLLEYVYEVYKTEELSNMFSKTLYEFMYEAKDVGKFKEYVKPTYEDLRGF